MTRKKKMKVMITTQKKLNMLNVLNRHKKTNLKQRTIKLTKNGNYVKRLMKKRTRKGIKNTFRKEKRSLTILTLSEQRRALLMEEHRVDQFHHREPCYKT